MADETVYRFIAGANVALTEDAAAKTVEISVPGLDSKLNVGDVGFATEIARGLIEIATVGEVQALADAVRAVTPAGLAALLQASTYDATANRLLKPGSFGLGGGISTITTPDLNDVRPAGFYYVSDAINKPGGAGGDGFLIQLQHASTGYAVQLYVPYGTAALYLRLKSNFSYANWRKVFDDNNFDPSTKADVNGYYPAMRAGFADNLADDRGTNNSAQVLCPSGMVAFFAQAAVPSGWLQCNGQAVSRTQYPSLFAKIGTVYGTGNGSTTFNLPDLRGMFPRGWDDNRGIDPSRVFGTTQNSANLAHTHSLSIVAAGGHTHAASNDTHAGHTHAPLSMTGSNRDDADPGDRVMTAPVGEDNGVRTMLNSSTGLGGGHTHVITVSSVADHTHTGSAASNGTNEARPSNVALLACIKY